VAAQRDASGRPREGRIELQGTVPSCRAGRDLGNAAWTRSGRRGGRQLTAADALVPRRDELGLHDVSRPSLQRAGLAVSFAVGASSPCGFSLDGEASAVVIVVATRPGGLAAGCAGRCTVVAGVAAGGRRAVAMLVLGIGEATGAASTERMRHVTQGEP